MTTYHCVPGTPFVFTFWPQWSQEQKQTTLLKMDKNQVEDKVHEIYICKLGSKWAQWTLLFKLLLGKHLGFHMGLTYSEKQNHTENRKSQGRSSFRRQTHHKYWGEDNVT